ncbi:MAG: hypothetical protein ACI8SE_002046, partial [Bacteroidia bacterium]
MFRPAYVIFDKLGLINFQKGIVCLAIGVLLLICIPFNVYGQQYLTENKGQWNDQILFKKQTVGAIIYLKNKGISILQYDVEAWAKTVDHPHHSERKIFKSAEKPISVNYHHFEMEFVGANEQCVIQGEA